MNPSGQSNAIERENISADVVVVGAGPAGLACAIQLAELFIKHNKQTKSQSLKPENIFVLEKASQFGMHSLSGAIMDPRGLQDLIPDYKNLDVPLNTAVQNEALFYLTAQHAYRSPFIPTYLHNRGNHIISLGQLVRWLANRAEQLGVTLLTSIAGKQLLMDGKQVVGVQTDDKGIDKNGNKKSNFEAGINLHAKLTVLAEGARGSLTKQLVQYFKLDKDCNPPAYGLGVKELWEIPTNRIKPGTAWHTLGYPLDKNMSGGGWLYALQDNRLSLGLVSGLSYSRPTYDPHQALQHFKQHPLIRKLLKGGKLLHYGAKTLSQGGYWSLPKPFTSGALIIGDGAGLVDTRRLKGIHLAIKSGQLAAETLYDVLHQQDTSKKGLSGFQDKLVNSWIHNDLWKARNHHQALQNGIVKGVWHLIAQQLSGGRGFFSRYKNSAPHEYLRKLDQHTHTTKTSPPDNTLTFTKSTSVYHAGTRHEADQPGHLILAHPEICMERCAKEFGNPCQYFCPASVYEVVRMDGKPELKLNPANCIHCKTCDILDPYQIITWQPPEGGGGPQYESM